MWHKASIWQHGHMTHRLLHTSYHTECVVTLYAQSHVIDETYDVMMDRGAAHREGLVVISLSEGKSVGMQRTTSVALPPSCHRLVCPEDCRCAADKTVPMPILTPNQNQTQGIRIE